MEREPLLKTPNYQEMLSTIVHKKAPVVIPGLSILLDCSLLNYHSHIAEFINSCADPILWIHRRKLLDVFL